MRQQIVSYPDKAGTARNCQVGDKVTTDFDKDRSGITEHVIIKRKLMCPSQPGVCFKVSPPIRLAGHDWIDADWFKPV